MNVFSDPWRADQAVTSFAAGPSGGGAELEANLTYSFDALKIIRKENVVEMMEFIRAEIDLMSAITHEHIVRLHDYQVFFKSIFLFY